ncbi:hypothetical protein ACGFY9_16475 [Streptomyces sp. NPDC048504]|uniref:hypothetical protein n=1 Tax=Streptomyces sp. NPDC048504 TaxID=3365559 RepID=UPI00371FED89
MAVLAVLVPPLMLGLVLALGRYEELLLPEPEAARPAPAAAPTDAAPSPIPAGSPASSPRIPVPSIDYGSPRIPHSGLPRV